MKTKSTFTLQTKTSNSSATTETPSKPTVGTAVKEKESVGLDLADIVTETKEEHSFSPRKIKFQDLVEEDLRRQYLIRLVGGILLIGVLVVLPTFLVMGVSGKTAYYSLIVALISYVISLSLNELGRTQFAVHIVAVPTIAIIDYICFDNSMRLYIQLTALFALVIPITVVGLTLTSQFTFGYGFAGVLLAVIGMAVCGRFTNSGPDNPFIITITLCIVFVLFLLMAIAWGTAKVVRRAFINSEWQNHQLLDYNRQMGTTLESELRVSQFIASLSEQLSRISSEQSQRSNEQAKAITTVTSTLEELSATARHVAVTANDVFNATNRALTTAQRGSQIIEQGIESIKIVSSNVENIAGIASELGQQSRRVEEIVEMISELADETNLLALNATIEASGAGEYGRRFAVVAAEVQNLANRSRTAARDVQAVIAQVRDAINRSLTATESGLDEARDLSEGATDTRAVISEILDTVQNTTLLAQQISLTTQQQRSATDLAVEMSRDVVTVAQETATRASQLLDVSIQLNKTAASLKHS